MAKPNAPRAKDLSEPEAPEDRSDRNEKLLQGQEEVKAQVIRVLEGEKGVRGMERKILQESKNNAEEMVAFAKRLLNHLPEDEKNEFIEDPLRFISKSLVFRGLTAEKYDQLIKDREFNLFPDKWAQ